ncbi:uncharacterized protein SAPINGB_P004501 [Magnusiomyces paraingens]|uniref:Acireductone dioxygenase n=1 Tax=Magnusiomyces paraingens TaxID=2606893 RepID=A0A5E8BU47_9ASCO|nr:uncharacterized protein SAPINGB_P004501 [Saprochaete ingens]VVT55248.1 unnamed protein product [Saprochaete ingens]
MKSYYHDGLENEDKRLPHESSEEVSLKELNSIGVYTFHFDELTAVDALAQERNYRARDEVVVSPEALGSWKSYHAQLDTFYKEHLHEDEEIRYVLDGAGYFDVRNKAQDRWIRTYVTKGDLMILPSGIYHRFTLTTDNYIKNMRLFQDKPKWMAINRPEADTNLFREEYLKEISTH